jgi:hypothetical protein
MRLRKQVGSSTFGTTAIIFSLVSATPFALTKSQFGHTGLNVQYGLLANLVRQLASCIAFADQLHLTLTFPSLPPSTKSLLCCSDTTRTLTPQFPQKVEGYIKVLFSSLIPPPEAKKSFFRGA